MINTLYKLTKFTAVIAGIWVIAIAGSIIFSGRLNPEAQADVAIVLGAAVYTDKASPVFAERVNHGVTLYKQEKVRALIFTGGLAEGDKISEAQAAKNIAVAQGIPERDIFLETRSTNTGENLQYANSIMQQQQWATAAIVSDPHHLRRAHLHANKLNMTTTLAPTPTSRYAGIKTKSKELVKEVYLVSRLLIAGY